MVALRTGSASGGTGNSCSPRTRSGARLVTMILSAGHASSRSATTIAAVDDLLEIVQHQQQVLVAQIILAAPCRIDWLPSASLQPQRLRDRRVRRVGIADRRQRDEADAVGEIDRGTSSATCTARRVLPVPPGPVKRQQAHAVAQQPVVQRVPIPARARSIASAARADC